MSGVTEDSLLGGRVRLRQPAEGYRVAIDPVLLAASIPAGDMDAVLDIGCGVGAAALCLAARQAKCRIAGIEIQRDLVRLGGENIELNGHEGRVSIMQGDLLRPPPRLEPGSFNHVMANPPFLEEGSATPPGDASRREAHIEGEADLKAWVRFAIAMARPKGSITFIHRADRLDRLLAEMAGRVGEIVVFPLWPGVGKPAKRVILRGRKDVGTPTRLAPGLILHEANGAFTPEVEAILREGQALAL